MQEEEDAGEALLMVEQTREEIYTMDHMVYATADHLFLGWIINVLIYRIYYYKCCIRGHSFL
jgi:hypothetical protein